VDERVAGIVSKRFHDPDYDREDWFYEIALIDGKKLDLGIMISARELRDWLNENVKD
jgi:hypothetical protein